MKIDELVAILGIEVDQQKLQNANSALKKIEDHFFSIKTAVVAAALATFEFEKRISDSAVQMQNISDDLGLSTDKFQELEFAASKAGVPIDAVTSAIGKLNAQQEGVKIGIVPTQLWEMLARLQRLTGVTINGYGKTGTQIFNEVGNAILGMKNKLDQAYVSQQIFGADLVPFFEDLKEANAEIKKEGWIVSDADLKRLKEAHFQIVDLKTGISFLAMELGATLAPSFTEFTQALLGLTKERGLVVLFEDLGTAIGFVAKQIGDFVKNILALDNLIGELTQSLGELFTGKFKDAFSSMGTAFKEFNPTVSDPIFNVLYKSLIPSAQNNANDSQQSKSNSIQNLTNTTHQNTTVNISNPLALNTSYMLNRTF